MSFKPNVNTSKAFPRTSAPCRFTAAGSLQPSTPILPGPMICVIKRAAPRLLSKQGRGFVFHCSDSHDKVFIRIRLQTRPWLRASVALVDDSSSQIGFISHDFTLLASATAAHCSKAFKYMVKGRMIGSEYVCYTVVAC